VGTLFTINLMVFMVKSSCLNWALSVVWNLCAMAIDLRACFPFIMRDFEAASRAGFSLAKVTQVLALIIVFSGCCVFSAKPAHARGKALFHATSKAMAQKIRTQGINPAKFKSGARFGKGFYLSRKASTAIAEKGKSSEVMAFKENKYIKNNTIDIRKPTVNKIQSVLGNIDLRGKFKKWIIGPNLGQKLGKHAANKGKIIEYRSVKNRGTNLVIPKEVIEKHLRVIKPEKIIH
jgi:hypothetical protein